ncbi:hypothetical protein BH20ACT5_BH20ACT5_19840 [soil metagenome]
MLWTAAVLAGVVLLTWAWSGSDIANTDRLVATAEPVQLAPAGVPAAGVRRVWAAASDPDADGVVENYTVIVGAGDGLSGLDPVTGEERWHYRRTTARLCDWTAADGVVVAVFGTPERCTDAVALDAGTGAREWYRNVNFAGDMTLSSTNQITLASSPRGLAALGTTTSGKRWNYTPADGCQITDSAVGDVGAVLILDCGDLPPSVVTLDGFEGTQRWTARLRGPEARLLAVTGVVGVLQPGPPSLLSVFDRDGRQTGSVSDLTQTSAPPEARPRARLLGERLLVFTGSTVSVLDAAGTAITWTVPSATMPALLGARLVLVEDGSLVERDVATGAVLRTVPIEGAAPPGGGRLDQVGTIVVVSAPGQVAGYG